MWRPPKASTASATAALLAGIGHVGLDEAAVELLGDRLASCPVDVGDHHVRAQAGQMPGDALTDAVAPSGDEGDLSVDVECHALDRRGTCSAQPRRALGSGWACTTLRCWIGRVRAT
jgi:hypothetical protein